MFMATTLSIIPVPSNTTLLLEAMLEKERLCDLSKTIEKTSECRWAYFYHDLESSSDKIGKLSPLKISAAFDKAVSGAQTQLRDTQALLKNKSIKYLDDCLTDFCVEVLGNDTAKIMDCYEKYKEVHDQLKKQITTVPHALSHGSFDYLEKDLQRIWNEIEERVVVFNKEISSQASSDSLLLSSSTSAFISSTGSSSSSSFLTSTSTSTFGKRDITYDIEQAVRLHATLKDIDKGSISKALQTLLTLNTQYFWGEKLEKVSMTLWKRVQFYYGNSEIRSAQKLKTAIESLCQEFALNLFEESLKERGKDSAEKICKYLLELVGVYEIYIKQYKLECYEYIASTPEGCKRMALGAIWRTRLELKSPR